MTIQSNLREPATLVEIDNTNANQGPALLPMRVMLVGQKTSAGTAAQDTFVRVVSADDVATKAGHGSNLHQMAIAFFDANQGVNEVWIGVLAEPSGGTQATTLITVPSSPAAGTINLYIAGIKVPVVVNAGEANTDVAAAITAAVNGVTASGGMPVIATQGTSGNANKVTLTVRGKGLYGNEIDVRVDYAPEDDSPPDLDASVYTFTSGAGEPDLTALITALGDQWFHAFVLAYSDSTSLGSMEAELLRRFQPIPAVQGQMFYGKAGSYSTVTTLGLARNSPFGTLVPAQGSPTPPWMVAAATAGVAVQSFQADPALGLQTVELTGVLAPAPADRWTFQERNTALFDGVSTWSVDNGGTPRISRLITTYQTNAASAPDESYLDLATMFNLMYLRFSLTDWLKTKFARTKLASDGIVTGPGQKVATPSMIKGEVLNWFDQVMLLALVEDKASFKTNLVVARDNSNPNRVNILLPPNLTNNLLDIAATLAFIL